MKIKLTKFLFPLREKCEFFTYLFSSKYKNITLIKNKCSIQYPVLFYTKIGINLLNSLQLQLLLR